MLPRQRDIGVVLTLEPASMLPLFRHSESPLSQPPLHGPSHAPADVLAAGHEVVVELALVVAVGIGVIRQDAQVVVRRRLALGRVGREGGGRHGVGGGRGGALAAGVDGSGKGCLREQGRRRDEGEDGLVRLGVR